MKYIKIIGFFLLLLSALQVSAQMDTTAIDTSNLEDAKKNFLNRVGEFFDVKMLGHAIQSRRSVKADNLKDSLKSFRDRTEGALNLGGLSRIQIDEVWPNLLNRKKYYTVDGKVEADTALRVLNVTNEFMIIGFKIQFDTVNAETYTASITASMDEVLSGLLADKGIFGMIDTMDQHFVDYFGGATYTRPTDAPVADAIIALFQTLDVLLGPIYDELREAQILAGNVSETFEHARDDFKFTFAPADDYGYDSYDQLEWANHYDVVRLGDGTLMPIDYKAQFKNQLADTAGFKVTAHYVGAPAELNLSQLVFKTKDGTTINRTGELPNFELTLPVQDKDYIIYAMQGEDKLGKLHVFVRELKTRKLLIVPTGASTDLVAGNVKTALNNLYNKYLISWEVSIDSVFTDLSWDQAGNGMQIEESNLLSNYSDEMKGLRDLYKEQRPAYPKDAYLVFEIPGFESSTDQGYMVRGKAMGFVKKGSGTITLAHELGHGAFGLEHTFPTVTKSSTTNLMDYAGVYSAPDNLRKFQWQRAHSNAPIISLFDDEEDAAYAVNILPSADIVWIIEDETQTEDINCIYTPSGHFIRVTEPLDLAVASKVGFDKSTGGVSNFKLVGEEKRKKSLGMYYNHVGARTFFNYMDADWQYPWLESYEQWKIDNPDVPTSPDGDDPFLDYVDWKEYTDDIYTIGPFMRQIRDDALDPSGGLKESNPFFVELEVAQPTDKCLALMYSSGGTCDYKIVKISPDADDIKPIDGGFLTSFKEQLWVTTVLSLDPEECVQGDYSRSPINGTLDPLLANEIGAGGFWEEIESTYLQYENYELQGSNHYYDSAGNFVPISDSDLDKIVCELLQLYNKNGGGKRLLEKIAFGSGSGFSGTIEAETFASYINSLNLSSDAPRLRLRGILDFANVSEKFSSESNQNIRQKYGERCQSLLSYALFHSWTEDYNEVKNTIHTLQDITKYFQDELNTINELIYIISHSTDQAEVLQAAQSLDWTYMEEFLSVDERIEGLKESLDGQLWQNYIFYMDEYIVKKLVLAISDTDKYSFLNKLNTTNCKSGNETLLQELLSGMNGNWADVWDGEYKEMMDGLNDMIVDVARQGYLFGNYDSDSKVVFSNLSWTKQKPFSTKSFSKWARCRSQGGGGVDEAIDNLNQAIKQYTGSPQGIAVSWSSDGNLIVDRYYVKEINYDYNTVYTNNVCKNTAKATVQFADFSPPYPLHPYQLIAIVPNINTENTALFDDNLSGLMIRVVPAMYFQYLQHQIEDKKTVETVTTVIDVASLVISAGALGAAIKAGRYGLAALEALDAIGTIVSLNSSNLTPEEQELLAVYQLVIGGAGLADFKRVKQGGMPDDLASTSGDWSANRSLPAVQNEIAQLELKFASTSFGTGSSSIQLRESVIRYLNHLKKLGRSNGVIALENIWKNGWTPQQVLDIPKLNRPLPSVYLVQKYIDQHLLKFDGEVSCISFENSINTYGQIGRNDGLFVMPKAEMDDLLTRTNGDIGLIEAELGIPSGNWSSKLDNPLNPDKLVRIDVHNSSNHNLRMADGNEEAADELLWLPGGRTPANLSEAVIDPIPLSNANQYKKTIIAE